MTGMPLGSIATVMVPSRGRSSNSGDGAGGCAQAATPKHANVASDTRHTRLGRALHSVLPPWQKQHVPMTMILLPAPLGATAGVVASRIGKS